jgi:hypothetical protein
MEERKNIKISLSAIVLILAMIVIVIMSYLVYKFYNEKTIETEKVSDLNNQITSLQSTIDNLQGTIDTISNTINSTSVNASNSSVNVSNTSNSSSNGKGYIELNEANFNKYNNENYSFDILSISKNNDGTYTISGRVYEEVELPTLSKDEYQQLKNGNKVNIFGIEFVKSADDVTDFGEYDFSISSNSDQILNSVDFFVMQNSDGTASLYYGSEYKFVKTTNIYMSATVNKTVFDEEYSEYSSDEKSSSDNYTIIVNDTYDIEFQNGKISSFKWTGV